MISRQAIQDMFDSSRGAFAAGRMKWDIDQICRWSYFFIDVDRERLLAVGRHLETVGYELRGFLEPSSADDTTIYLRVDRIERHTVDSLLARNDELYLLASRFDLRAYDGMDVGAADGP
jgi:hypothetical protein